MLFIYILFCFYLYIPGCFNKTTPDNDISNNHIEKVCEIHVYFTKRFIEFVAESAID